MEDAESVLVSGYRLDRFELLCPIASGGMASVWLARLRGKRGFEKLFAIKTIKTELISDPRFQEMFLDEARIASAIEHPNVAQILDLGEQDNVLYIVMEWVDGESLAKISRLALKRGTPLLLGMALRVVADACAGLHAAHELKDAQDCSRGVVHRDVSPQNILVTTAGAVKVIDFGVAKARDRSAGETRSGTVKGKIRYMSPEQIKGLEIDRRADLWAAGICLHELVTGRVPFEDESDVDVIKRLMGEEPAPVFDPTVPESVRHVFAHSIVSDREKRFATAAAMRRALEAAMSEIGLPASSEDLAEFVRVNLPDLAKKRRESVARTVEAADTRGTHSASTRVVEAVSADAALAPTVVARTHEPDEAKVPSVLPLMKKKVGKPRRSSESKVPSRISAADSKSTGGATLSEQVSERPRSRSGIGWVVLLVATFACAWFGWPGGARLRAALLSAPPPEPPSQPARAAEPPSPAVAVPPLPVASVSASPSSASSVATRGPEAGSRRHAPRSPEPAAPLPPLHPEDGGRPSWLPPLPTENPDDPNPY